MKIVSKPLRKTADISSARGTALKELRQLVLFTIVLLIALYFSVGWIVDLIVSGISFETEATLFKHFSISKTFKKDYEENKKLEKAEEILAKFKSDKLVPPLPYELVLIDEKQPNAFAFPGGKIGITTGLLNAVNDDIELAFVLGHELGHFRNRDHLQGLGRAAGFGFVMVALFNTDYGAESLGKMINFVLERNYSQDREKKADRLGLELVYAAYGKIKGTEHLFKILEGDRKVPEWAYMFSTHPSPKQRILELQKFGQRLVRTNKH